MAQQTELGHDRLASDQQGRILDPMQNVAMPRSHGQYVAACEDFVRQSIDRGTTVPETMA